MRLSAIRFRLNCAFDVPCSSHSYEDFLVLCFFDTRGADCILGRIYIALRSANASAIYGSQPDVFSSQNSLFFQPSKFKYCKNIYWLSFRFIIFLLCHNFFNGWKYRIWCNWRNATFCGVRSWLALSVTGRDIRSSRQTSLIFCLQNLRLNEAKRSSFKHSHEIPSLCHPSE